MALMRAVVDHGTGGLTVEVVEGPMRDVDKVVNLNAYPLVGSPLRERLKAYAEGCRDHLAVVGHAVEVVGREINDDGDRLYASLIAADFGDIEVLIPRRPRIVRHGMGYFAGLFTALGAAKSALDCFTILAVHIIHPGNKNQKLEGFHKATDSAGDTISGARIIKWLRRESGNGAPDFKDRAVLADLIERATREWITEAVKYRDDLVHHGHIRGARGSTLVLDQPIAVKRREDIQPPAMPNGVLVADYCVQVHRRLLTFVYEASTLLPNVDAKLLTRPQ